MCPCLHPQVMQVVREQITRTLSSKPTSLELFKNKVNALNYSEILKLRQTERLHQEETLAPPVLWVAGRLQLALCTFLSPYLVPLFRLHGRRCQSLQLKLYSLIPSPKWTEWMFLRFRIDQPFHILFSVALWCTLDSGFGYLFSVLYWQESGDMTCIITLELQFNVLIYLYIDKYCDLWVLTNHHMHKIRVKRGLCICINHSPCNIQHHKTTFCAIGAKEFPISIKINTIKVFAGFFR